MTRNKITQPGSAGARTALADDPRLEMIRARYAHPHWQIGDRAHRTTVANLIAEVERLQAQLAAVRELLR